MLLRRLGALVCAFALSFNSFAANKNVPMPLGERLPVEAVLNQQELGVDVSTTGAAVAGAVIGGLIGGLVSAAIANAQVKAAEERVTPLRDLLVGYDFNRQFEAQIRAKLPSEGLSLDPVITTTPTHWAMLDPQSGKQLPRQALVLMPRYAIDSKFATLRVQVVAQLVDRTPKSNGKLKGKILFHRIYGFNHQIKDGKLEDNLQQWTSLGSNGMGMLLDQGLEQVVAMIVHDFTAEGRGEWTRRSNPKKPPTLKGQNYPGVAVRTTDDYIWVRSGPRMMMFNGHHPLDVPAFLATMQSAPAPAEAVVAAAEPVAADQPVADAQTTTAVDAVQTPSTEQAATAPAPAAEPSAQPQPEAPAEGRP